MLLRSVGRVEHGSPRTFSSETWIWKSRTFPWMAEGSKLWRKGCLFSGVASRPSTPRWCQLCTGTGFTAGTRTKQTASLCEKHELQGRNGRVRMVVIAGEVGRWSEETKPFLCTLACGKSRSEARVLRKSVRAAWCRRWCCLLACAAAKAVALSLLERRGVSGVGDDPPTTHEVVAATFREVYISSSGKKKRR